MTQVTEIKLCNNKRYLNRNFGFTMFSIVKNAKIGKRYECETAHGTLIVYKHKIEYGTQYNVYFFKHSLIRRAINFVDSFRWT